MSASAFSALVFLPFVLPVCLWVVWSDLKYMKIRNIAVLILLAIFVVGAPFMMPLAEFGLHLGIGAAVFSIGFVLYMARGIGAGDVKFAGAMAPFFHPGDGALILYLFAAVLAAALVAHRLARRIGPVRKATPDWISWDAKRFPMGIALAPTLLFYLFMAAFAGS